jgi:hypothetical protein
MIPPLDRLQKLAAIACAACCLGLVAAIALNDDLSGFINAYQQNHPRVIEAAIKHKGRQILIGLVLPTIFYGVICKAAPTMIPTVINRVINSWTSKISTKFSGGTSFWGRSFGAIAITVVLLIFYASSLSTAERATLTCERSSNSCEILRKGLWQTKTQQFSLQELKGAYVQTSRSSEGMTARVALVLSEEEIPLTHASYSPGLEGETSRQINFFVNHPTQPSLQVSADNRWVVLSLVSIFATIHIVVLFNFFH